jgi:serine/threonine protein kinase
MIYACPKDWKGSYIQKYTAKRGAPLPEKQVASFSRQILEGMMFLERKGWPYQVVSTGNVLLSRSQSHCQLCDVESSILDVAPRVAPLVRSFALRIYSRACFLTTLARRCRRVSMFRLSRLVTLCTRPCPTAQRHIFVRWFSLVVVVILVFVQLRNGVWSGA